jgi:hypothetical protein
MPRPGTNTSYAPGSYGGARVPPERVPARVGPSGNNYNPAPYSGGYPWPASGSYGDMVRRYGEGWRGSEYGDSGQGWQGYQESSNAPGPSYGGGSPGGNPGSTYGGSGLPNANPVRTESSYTTVGSVPSRTAMATADANPRGHPYTTNPYQVPNGPNSPFDSRSPGGSRLGQLLYSSMPRTRSPRGSY